MRATDHERDPHTASHVWTDAPGDASPRLIVLWLDHVIVQRLDRNASIEIGRAPECDVHVDHKSVSRRHARVSFTEDGFVIEDLASANGTFVRGARLTPGVRVPLEPGSIASFGVASLVVQPASGGEIRRAGAPTLPPPGPLASPWPADGPMAPIQRLLRLVAAGDIPVLLLGETGVGKELVAELVHACSPRATRPLVKLNCAALPEALLEGELFGYERGAFTGATHAKPGLFEVADGGSLFLDEVGELPPATQAKLLRALDAKQVQRLGSLAPRTVDVRIIAATNRDLAEQVAARGFRADLFYRLAGMPVELPPLRQRPNEIEPLAHGFLSQAAERLARPLPEISPAAIAELQAYEFPGNVRELKSVVERALLVCEGARLEPEHLMLPKSAQAPPSADLRSQLKAFERDRIARALEQSGGNQSAAARLLGIGRRTLIDKLAEHGLASKRRS